MTKPVERLLSKLQNVKQTGKGWSARCPAHEDRRPSLSIRECKDGSVLAKCHAGCKIDAICAAVGLTVRDLMRTADMLPMPGKPKTKGKVTNGKPQIIDQYDYRDEAGELLLQVVRFDPKDFRQRKPKPGGGWDWRVKGVRVVPFRLPELLADPARPVFIVEGEKDANALAGLGFVATCNAGGAGKWLAAHSEFLRGRIVFIVPDNDEAGGKHAQQVAQLLQGIADSVRIVELPDLPDKGDASDWIAAGGTKEQLEKLAEAALEWKPTASWEPGPVLTCLADVTPRAVSWLWPGRIPMGRITLLVGRPGEGKSFLTTDAAARVTTGMPWPDGSICPKGSVILISAEDDPADTIRPRLDAHSADVRRVHLLSAVRSVHDDGPYDRVISLADIEAIETALKRVSDCRMIVVDPIGSFLGGGTDSHRDNEVRGVLAPIAALAEKYGPAVIVVAHRRKSAGSVADDLALGSRAFTGIARAVWHLTSDTECKARRLLLPGKNNLAREGDGLAFSITGDPPRIEWEPDPVAMSADDALLVESRSHDRKPGPNSEALDTAVNWLRSALANCPRLAKELADEWCNGNGGSKRTLDRAKQALNVEAYRENVPGPWWWKLSDKNANSSENAELGNLGDLAVNAEVLTNYNTDESKDADIKEPGSLCPERVRVTI